MIKIRRAKIGDVRPMHKLLGVFSERRELLPRAISELYENLQQFHVAEDKGTVIGCCSLAVQWDNLAEVKALGVDPEYQGQGIGRKLVDACIKDAKTLGRDAGFCADHERRFFFKNRFSSSREEPSAAQSVDGMCAVPLFPGHLRGDRHGERSGRCPPAPAFKAADLPSDGTVPIEPEGFAPVLSKRKSLNLPSTKKMLTTSLYVVISLPCSTLTRSSQNQPTSFGAGIWWTPMASPSDGWPR
jgi:amino-acid N-acetyltransferase